MALFSLAVPVTAGDFSLISPIACDLNGPCYIQQYVDHDGTDAASDFTCSGLSYDGHKGTDFALPTYDYISKGIDVVASAAGTVGGTRDGVADVRYSSENAASVQDKECGNGVVIRHEGGWETQYCHLRQGSITVVQDQNVEVGTVLGQVGMSGRAEFPHVHLSVRRDGAVIDPFDPDGNITCNTVETETLWANVPPYRPGGIVTVGTSATIPEFEDIRANTVLPPDANSDALVIYAFLFGTRESDIISLALSGPEGTVIKRDVLLKRNQAQSFRAIGKKLRSDRWPAGTYTGTAELRRAGTVLEREEIELIIP
ncbi:M23 family metallopeptidase [Sulfitobacter guttiformis]|nr:M23 family metallopeptidase [Sulfitobacter guttiformis]